MGINLKELVLIALVITIIFVLGYIFMPIMTMLPLAAYKALIMAPVYSAGIVFILKKIPKRGVVLLAGTLLGLLLSLFSPFMLIISVLSALFTEIICYLIFRNYENEWAISLAGGLFPAAHVPITLFVMGYIVGGPFFYVLKKTQLLLGMTLFVFILAFYIGRCSLKVITKRKI